METPLILLSSSLIKKIRPNSKQSKGIIFRVGECCKPRVPEMIKEFYLERCPKVSCFIMIKIQVTVKCVQWTIQMHS